MELLVVVAVILIFSVVGYPNFVAWIAKERIMGVVHSTSSRMQVARQEAIRTNDVVVAQPDFDNNEILFFVNVDQDQGYEFNPDSTVQHRTADYELGRLRLPDDYGIEFRSATNRHAQGNDALEGFTATNAPLNAVVFLPDGSVKDAGAIRLADDRSNFFEVRIAFPATGKTRVNKYHPNPPWGDRAGFFPRGRHINTGDPMWVWY
jgi:type II secretory pathway pseudopilin PulG